MFGIPKLFHEVPQHIITDRQKWFWRRFILFVTVFSLLGIHAVTVLGPLVAAQNWPLFGVVAVDLAAIIWLVTIYFVNVNSVEQLTNVVTSIGQAVGKARDGDNNDEHHEHRRLPNPSQPGANT